MTLMLNFKGTASASYDYGADADAGVGFISISVSASYYKPGLRVQSSLGVCAVAVQ